MIKIIDQPKSFICTCKRCGCIFEYEYTDLLMRNIDEYVIQCPICKIEHHHIVNEDVSEMGVHPYTPSNILGLPTSINYPPGLSGKDLKIVYGTECKNAYEG